MFSVPALGRSRQRTLCSSAPGPRPRPGTAHWSEQGPGPSDCDPVSALWFCFYKHGAAAQASPASCLLGLWPRTARFSNQEEDAR